MKNWIYSIAPTIIFFVLFAHFDSFLGLLHLWVLLLFMSVGLASYYVPYHLIEGEDRSSFYAFVCCCVVLYSAYQLEQHHRSGLKVYAQEICGVVANREDDDLPRFFLRKRSHLYQFDLLAGSQGIVHFRKESFAPRNSENVCVKYVDAKHSWMYAEHLILKIQPRII